MDTLISCIFDATFAHCCKAPMHKAWESIKLFNLSFT